MWELETYLSLQIFCLDWQLAQRVLDLWLDTSTPPESHVHTQHCVPRVFLWYFDIQTPLSPRSTFAEMWYTWRQYISELMTCVTRPACQRACTVFRLDKEVPSNIRDVANYASRMT